MSITDLLREIAADIADWKAMPAQAKKLVSAAADIDARIAGLEADLREEQDRRQAMRTEWGAEVAALTERINALRSDRDCEKRLRKDAEDAREAALERIAELEAQRFRSGSLAAPEAAPAVAAINARLSTDKEFATEFLREIDTRSTLGVGFSGGHCQTQEINYEPPPPLDWSK